MSTLTATQVATLPRVNLLPPELEEAQRFRRVQIGLGAAVLAAAGLVGAVTVIAIGQVSSAEDDLSAAKAQQTTLQAKVNEYAEIPVVYAQVEAAEAQLTKAMGQEVRWSYFLNDLSLKTPNKVWLTSMTVAQTVDAEPTVDAAAETGTEYMSPGLGTVSFQGKGFTHNDVAAWLVALAKQKGLSQPYFTSSTKELIGTEDSVTFTSQATITEDALSKRYTEKAGS